MIWILGFAAVWLAWTNGANDNMKGVATLVGSRTTSAKTALYWGTLATFAGSVCAIFLAETMLKAFSGKGIVSDAVFSDPTFLAAVGFGAAAVVTVATFLSMPISTTHALVGGLAGAGLAAGGLGGVEWTMLGQRFALPLLLTPFCSAGIVCLVYPILHRLRVRSGIESDTCVCIGPEKRWVPATDEAVAMACGLPAPSVEGLPRLHGEVGPSADCAEKYQGAFLGFEAQRFFDGLHFLSAGAVSFARGLNDTPKIAALLLAVTAFGGEQGTGSRLSALAIIGGGMAIGALVQALKVGHTMSEKITPMNSGQALTANCATAFMVLIASRFGMPASTTHVSVGALFGLGASSGELVRSTMLRILSAWALTIPLAMGAAALAFFLVGAGG